MRPVDPQTLEDLPGYPAVDFGRYDRRAFSPDGRTLAVLSWPDSGSPMDRGGGTLRLVDLASWTARPTGVVLPEQAVLPPAFSAGGRRLYWLLPGWRDPAHGIPRSYHLYRFDVAAGSMATAGDLPESFQPWSMQPLASGKIAIFGIPDDSNSLAEDAPHLLLVDPDAGVVSHDLRLEGVTAGQFHLSDVPRGQNPFRIYRPAIAWDAQRGLLSLVHAGAERVTVVDAEHGTVLADGPVEPRLSLLDRFWRRLNPVAEAKGVPATTKTALLSPDGARLYVTGDRPAEPAGEGDGPGIPMGLQVIDTETLAEVKRFNLPVSQMALSPDGKTLLLTGTHLEEQAGGAVQVSEGVYVIDTASLAVTAHIEDRKPLFMLGFSPDGRYAYTSHGDWDGGQYTSVTQVLDLASATYVAERRGFWLLLQ